MNLLKLFQRKPPEPTSNSPSVNNDLDAWRYTVQWEACERRLALSAMALTAWDLAQHANDVNHLNLDATSHTSDQAFHSDTTNDGSSSVGTSIAIQTQLAEAHAQTGWNDVQSQFGLNGKGQTIAVIDSGIAYDHVALGGGYGPGYRVVGGWDFAENDANPYDDAPAGFHGTHVAGIIGANDGTHFGVASGVDLVSLRVFNDAGKGELAWAEKALQWVHDHRYDFANPITTVNLSLGAIGGSATTTGILDNELAQLQQDGIVVVASAGNAFQQTKSTGLSYPASSPYVIPVASVDANGQLSDFSQRDARVIAAPGRNIESTVPDFFYGRDGDPNDWATASGTSMASPYIAGASALVREAMEMVGVHNITAQSIYDTLRSTAHSVWDSVTQQSYQSLDLEHAIASILPKDAVGDTLSTAQQTTIQSSWKTDGWINTLSDQDVYRLTPVQSGVIHVQLDSHYVSDAHFSLLRNGQSSALSLDHGQLSISVVAGESIGLSIADGDAIGSYSLNWNFVANPSPPPGPPPGPPPSPTPGPSGNSDGLPTKIVDLGRIDEVTRSFAGDAKYHVTASHDGIMSIVVDASGSTTGALRAFKNVSGVIQTLTDATIENNQWRIDIAVKEGEGIDFVLPGTVNRSVHALNLVQQLNDRVIVYGTIDQDRTDIDLSTGVGIGVNGVSYRFDSNVVKSIVLDGAGGSDTLDIHGSAMADQIEMRPGITTLDNGALKVQASNYEQVHFTGGGGPDRAYLYDADTNDRLNIWPNRAEMTGVGYLFQVDQVDRIFVNAFNGGDDQAFVFDSAGDDTLSVRPQFTSLSGPGFFNYVSGFEQVYAYATAGGVDQASLYDSAGNDQFSTSGEQTSIVGVGFSTFARGFENVEAFSTAGGIDRARIYASAGGQLTSGPDFVGMHDSTRSSIARTFAKVETFVGGNPVPLQTTTQSIDVFNPVVPITRVEPLTASDQPIQRLGLESQAVAISEQAGEWLTDSPLHGSDSSVIGRSINEIAARSMPWVFRRDEERTLLNAVFSLWDLSNPTS